MDAIHLPSGITLPTAYGGAVLPIAAGQVIQALVLELLDSGAFRLQLPLAVVDVRADVALTAGSTVTLAVKGAGANAKLVIYASDGAPLAPVIAGQGEAVLASRRPLGEAVIIGRAAAGVPARISGEAVVREAAPSGPVRAPVVPAVISPERAVADVVRAAAPRQSGLGPLFADVEQVISANAALPAPVRAAATTLLALRVPLDQNLAAADVKQALARSGVLFEPRLAAAREALGSAFAIPTLAPAAPTPGNDLKAALLVFREVLRAWSASEPAAVSVAAPSIPVVRSDQATPVPSPQPGADRSTVTPTADAVRAAVPLKAASIGDVANALASAAEELLPASSPLSAEQATALARTIARAISTQEAPSPSASPHANGGPPPPYRGAPLAPQAPSAASIAANSTPHEMAERLLAQADGALARQTLLQVASLPDQSDLSMPRTEPAVQRWNFEIPFVTPQGTGIAHFEVSRDGHAAKADVQARVWRARFSLDLEPMGPVHALIAITGERASVTLWAERQSTVTRLNEHAPMLSEALRAAELEPSEFLFRVGAPPLIAKPAAPGRFMDRAS